MMHKKAQGGSGVKMLIYVAIGVIILFVAYILITTWAKKGAVPGENLNSCTDPLVGEPGACDCYFPDGRCPSGSDGRVHMGCPNKGRYGACADADAYINAMKEAQKGYDTDMDALADAGPDMKRAVQSKHFGQCCVGAEIPGS